MIPPIYNRSYSISADLDNPGRSGLGLLPGIAGVIVAEGSFLGGFSLYVENGYLKHTYSLLGLKLDTISSRDAVPKGKVNVRYEFTADKPGEFGTGGTSRLFINGKQQAEGEDGAYRSVPVCLLRRHGYRHRQWTASRSEIRIHQGTTEVFQRHDRKGRVRTWSGQGQRSGSSSACTWSALRVPCGIEKTSKGKALVDASPFSTPHFDK